VDFNWQLTSGSKWWRSLSGGLGLSGQNLWGLWIKLITSDEVPEPFEFLLEKSSSLWAEVKLIVGPEPPAELGLQAR
jgi:hypothetical protein